MRRLLRLHQQRPQSPSRSSRDSPPVPLRGASPILAPTAVADFWRAERPDVRPLRGRDARHWKDGRHAAQEDDARAAADLKCAKWEALLGIGSRSGPARRSSTSEIRDRTVRPDDDEDLPS